MNSAAELGAALRDARKSKGLTAQQLSEATGLSRVTLRELETGLGNSRLSTLLAVCDALGLDLLTAPRQVAALRVDEPARPTELSTLLDQTRLAGMAYQRKKGAR